MTQSFDELIAAIEPCRNVLVTTHVRPDGDALGSAAAVHLALKQKNIASRVLLLSHLPRKYAFVFEETGVEFVDVESGWPANFTLDAYDALLVVDTGTWSQLPGLEQRVAAFKGRKLIVDHHLTQQDWADVKVVDTTAAAAGEIVEQVLKRWGVSIDRPIAMALFVAIASDTGWFAFSNTSPRTMRVAAELMEVGVDTDRLYQLLYQNESAKRVALMGRALQSLQLFAGDSLAVMVIRKQDFLETRAGVPDTENLINVPLQVRTVEVSMLITEPLDSGPVRISLRSKGGVDVARFAEQFGGGGHARASGLKIQASLDEAQRQVVSAMLERLQSAG